MGHHRVTVFTGPGQVELREEAIPPLSPGEVLVQLRACALCTMEQRLWAGRQNDYPIAAGHEAAGVVAAVHPEQVLNVEPGTRVAIAFLDRCMQCFHCRRGETHACTGKLHGRQAGKLRRIGGLSEFAAVPAWKLFAMPEHLSFQEIALAEPLACVVHSIHKGALCFGDDVLVIGGGTMGQLHLLLARLRGARAVVSEPDPQKRQVALEHGASAALEPAEATLRVRELTGGRGADVVFVTHGTEETARQAVAAVRAGGRIIYYGGFPSGVEPGLGPGRIHREEISLDGARGQTLEDWAQATRLLASRIIEVRRLISATYPLERVDAALRHAAEGTAFRVVIGLGG